MAAARVVLVLAIFLFISGRHVMAAPPCGSVIAQLIPCVSYLTGLENNPESGCCDGVKYLKDYTSDKEDRQSICACLESVAPMYRNLDFSLIPSLPKKCRVSVNVPKIDSPYFDCSKA